MPLLGKALPNGTLVCECKRDDRVLKGSIFYLYPFEKRKALFAVHLPVREEIQSQKVACGHINRFGDLRPFMEVTGGLLSAGLLEKIGLGTPQDFRRLE